MRLSSFLKDKIKIKLKKKEILKGKLSYFNKFIDNFDIIKKLYKEENKI